MRNIVVALALLAAAAGSPSLAQPAPQPAASAAGKIPIADFAAMPAMRKPVLSPDGHWVIARSTVDGRTHLALIDADQPEAPPKWFDLGEASVASLQWAGSNRLLLTVQVMQEIYGADIPILRLLSIDRASGNTRLVDGKSRGIYAGDVLYADPSGAWALVASQDDPYSWPSVKRVDLTTGEAEVVEKARNGVWDWYADEQGVVRLGIAISGRKWTIWYRESAGDKLQAKRGKFPKDDDSAVDRFIFGRDGKSWIITNERTGRFAVYRYDLEANSVGQPVYENAEVDIDEVMYDDEANAISAVRYHDDRPRTLWFDEASKKLQHKLDKALPETVNQVVQESDDGKRMLVWSGGASDPGLYYLLDTATSRMHPVIDPYVRIDPDRLAEVKAVRYTTRDGLSLRAYLTLPPGREARGLPLIVMPHGGPFARDEWEYDPEVQFLANRGYAVLQPQFRGSTGFGKDFVARGYGEIGKKMQDDLDDGVDWLTRTGQIDPARVCIVGASYGGYAAMWGAIRSPKRYRCAVSFAGVSDLPAQLRYDRKLFTASRYFREWRSQIAGEEKTDLRAVSPIHYADRLKIPILIVHGEADKTVPPRQSREMIEALEKAGANVTSAFYKNAGHGFDTSADLADYLRRLEVFLAKHNPA